MPNLTKTRNCGSCYYMSSCSCKKYSVLPVYPEWGTKCMAWIPQNPKLPKLKDVLNNTIRLAKLSSATTPNLQLTLNNNQGITEP